MQLDSLKGKIARENLESLCDIQAVLDFLCILPMLESVHALLKVVHHKDVFTCDFVGSVNMCKAELFQLYIDENYNYTDFAFNFFDDFSIFNNNHSLIVWMTDTLFSYRLSGILLFWPTIHTTLEEWSIQIFCTSLLRGLHKDAGVCEETML